MAVTLETARLYLREIQMEDYRDLCLFLQDIEVMYAWEHAFSDAEVSEWIEENIMRYSRDGYSYWAVIVKKTDQLIGVTGLLNERVEDEDYIGVGYIYHKVYWNKGYAFEAASACMDYAFEALGVKEITAQIRPDNTSSRKLAEKLGMTVKKEFIREYRGKSMRHVLYGKVNLD